MEQLSSFGVVGHHIRRGVFPRASILTGNFIQCVVVSVFVLKPPELRIPDEATTEQGEKNFEIRVFVSHTLDALGLDPRMADVVKMLIHHHHSAKARTVSTTACCRFPVGPTSFNW